MLEVSTQTSCNCVPNNSQHHCLRLHCSIFFKYQGSGTWPYAGLSLLKVKESLIVIQMVQTLHTSEDIYSCLHTQKCAHNVSTGITLISHQ